MRHKTRGKDQRSGLLHLAQRRLAQMRRNHHEHFPERIEHSLASVRQRLGLHRRVNVLDMLDAAWRSVVPAAIAGQTRVVAFRNGVLRIETSNVPWKTQTEAFHKQSLLHSLRQQLPENMVLRDVVLRIGVTTP